MRQALDLQDQLNTDVELLCRAMGGGLPVRVHDYTVTASRVRLLAQRLAGVCSSEDVRKRVIEHVMRVAKLRARVPGPLDSEVFVQARDLVMEAPFQYLRLRIADVSPDLAERLTLGMVTPVLEACELAFRERRGNAEAMWKAMQEFWRELKGETIGIPTLRQRASRAKK